MISLGAGPIWLAGGRGMLARAIQARLDVLGVSWVATDAELDIAERERVAEFARAHRPVAIVNAAAYTRVDDAEAHEADAVRVNADGPENLAIVAEELGVPLLHFSTDYVFDGAASAPYSEAAATNPRTAYGRSKLMGEQRVLKRLDGALGYVIRTSWLYGCGGPNFVKTMVTLMREREELKVVGDQHGRPTYTVDLAEAAARLLGLEGGERAAAGLYHFANAGQTSWHGFAEAILEASRKLGLDVRTARVLPCTTAEYPRPAPRPAYSVLDTGRIEQVLGRAPRVWREALSDYLIREFVTQERPS